MLERVKGQGAKGMREVVESQAGLGWHAHLGAGAAVLPGLRPSRPLALRPSAANNIEHGFASVSNFFPGTKQLSARLMEEIARACVGQENFARALVFDDQYMTTGGQLYELMMGHDRFIADMRPLFHKIQGQKEGMCVHPYDMSALLIAQEAGVVVTDGLGGPLDAPLDVDSSIQWAGFANAALRGRIEPVMIRVLNQWLEHVPPTLYT